MNIFVLSTGRSGSTAFAKACSHMNNYRSAHETWISLDGHLEFPDNHIEVSPQLTWHLDRLAIDYPDAYYVALVRNQDDVVDSMLRWDPESGGRIGGWFKLIGASIPWPNREAAVRLHNFTYYLVKTFVSQHKGISINIENIKVDFPFFWRSINAEGDIDAAMKEFSKSWNSSSK